MSFRASLSCVGLLALSLDANAGLFGLGSMSWSEEVALHDGSKIIVERSVQRGGRHEIGQSPPYKEQSLTFVLPATKQRVKWVDEYDKDERHTIFLPMMIEISGGTAYLVASIMGCTAFNKLGRPNPPYVVFKYQDKEWKRVALQELPIEIEKPNLLFSSPDTEMEKLGKEFITAQMIREIARSYRQPEYRTILREPFSKARLEQICEERVPYKGYWILPNDPIARDFIDKQKK